MERLDFMPVIANKLRSLDEWATIFADTGCPLWLATSWDDVRQLPTFNRSTHADAVSVAKAFIQWEGGLTEPQFFQLAAWVFGVRLGGI